MAGVENRYSPKGYQGLRTNEVKPPLTTSKLPLFQPVPLNRDNIQMQSAKVDLIDDKAAYTPVHKVPIKTRSLRNTKISELQRHRNELSKGNKGKKGKGKRAQMGMIDAEIRHLNLIGDENYPERWHKKHFKPQGGIRHHHDRNY